VSRPGADPVRLGMARNLAWKSFVTRGSLHDAGLPLTSGRTEEWRTKPATRPGQSPRGRGAEFPAR
jgi:hypothetical protein